MRQLRQPGPAPAERVESILGHGRALTFDLQPGLTLNDALTRPLVAAGFQAGALVFEGAALAPLRCVMPGPSPDAAHVAWFSAPRAVAEVRVQRANATFGWRDGAPFVHCHAAWIEPDGACRGGHILPDETLVAAGAPVRAWAVADVAIRAEPDPETNFTLFRPAHADGPSAGTPLLLARVRPNEEIGEALVALCRRLGLSAGRVRGSVGSLIGARFADGRVVNDHATEVLVTSGTVHADGRTALDMLVVDMQGAVHAGTLEPGANPVCITFEVALEPT